MNTDKVNKVVKLKMQIEALTRKLSWAIVDMTKPEFNEYLKRIAK